MAAERDMPWSVAHLLTARVSSAGRRRHSLDHWYSVKRTDEEHNRSIEQPRFLE